MKKFMTVLLVVAVLFTFSFGSAFATTGDASKGEATYMQVSDYLLSYVGKDLGPIANAKASQGITEAERAKLVDELETLAESLADDATAKYTYSGAQNDTFSGSHLTAVKAIVDNALAAVKAAKTSKAANDVYDNALKGIFNETSVAELTTDLLGDYTASENSTADTLFGITLDAGTYVLPGYKTVFNGGNVPVITDTAANAVTADAALLLWFFDNGYETKAGIESDAAKTAFKKAAKEGQLFTAASKDIYSAGADTDPAVTPYGVTTYYEWRGYAKAMEAAAINDIDAVYAAKKNVKAFEKKVGDGVTYSTGYAANYEDTAWNSAVKVYYAITFKKAYDDIMELPTKSWVAHKAEIEKLATDVAAFKDKYGITDLSTYGISFDLSAQLTAILNDGVATLQDAYKAVGATYPEVVDDINADALAALKTAEAAFYKEYVASGIFGNATVGFTENARTMTKPVEIAEYVEAYVAACEANLGLSDKEDVKDAAKLQAYLNNATVKVTTTALGNNKIRVQARFDADTYKDIVDQLKDGYTVSYKFYHKTDKATTYKAANEKDRNYITYTKKSLKKGTKYKFRCEVIVKDAKGNVVATKDYKASTVGSRICR